jgi:hypothetical protein
MDVKCVYRPLCARIQHGDSSVDASHLRTGAGTVRGLMRTGKAFLLPSRVAYIGRPKPSPKYSTVQYSQSTLT